MSEDAYLDAARACIVAVGWRRTTLTDIARRAGVSRMTIYRAWPDMHSLLSDLLVREWSGLLVESGLVPAPDGAAEPSRAPGAARISESVAATVTALRGNELLQRIIEVDPELLSPYLFERAGRNQRLVLELVSEQIAAGQAAGLVREADPVDLARAVLLSCYGFVLSAHTLVADTEAFDEQLGVLVERYLQP